MPADTAVRSGRPRVLRPAALALALVAATTLAACDRAVAPPPPPAPADPVPSAAGPVLAPATAAAASLPLGDVDRLLSSGPLGPDPGAVVLDARTGEVLLDRDAARPRTPASVAKLLTGAAALATIDLRTRFATRVVRAPDGTVVLVGGGDARLTARSPSRAGASSGRASLVSLADDTAAALRGEGVGEVRVRVDDTLFAAPALSPGWPASYVRSGVVAPVSALTLDGGRVRPGRDQRSADPALDTGEAFAALLVERGLEVVDDIGRAAAAAGAVELATVESAPLAELVEVMLTDSDNDLAEALLRHVALAAGRPPTFAGGTAAVADALGALGLPTAGLVLLDGSGLARGSAVAPATLGQLLVAAAGTGTDAALDHLLSGLPVAGLSGTLSLRYGRGDGAEAAGLVRAKTGTLTGVSALAGLAAPGGRPLVFVVVADGVPGDTVAARAVLDQVAATLATG